MVVRVVLALLALGVLLLALSVSGYFLFAIPVLAIGAIAAIRGRG